MREKYNHKEYNYIHQKNNFTSVEISRVDGEKVFIKRYHRLSEEDVRKKYSKYQFFYNNLPSDDVRTPEPKYVQGKSIVFEYIDLPENKRLNRLLVQDEEVKCSAIKRAAKALKLVHGIGSPKGYIHGDFWYGNIFMFNDYVYVVDFEMPARLQQLAPEKGPVKSKEFDIAYFFHQLFAVHESHLKAYFVNHNKYHEIFLRTYKKAGGKIDRSSYKKAWGFLYREHMQNIVNGNRTAWYKAPAHIILLTVRIALHKYCR